MKKLSKILSLVLAVSLIASCFAINVMAASKAHTVTVAADKTTGLVAGDVVTVTVALDNTADIGSMQCFLKYDADVFEVDETLNWLPDYSAQLAACIDADWYQAQNPAFKNIIKPDIIVNTAESFIMIAGAGNGQNGIPAGAAVDNYVFGKFYFKVKTGVDSATAVFEIGTRNENGTIHISKTTDFTGGDDGVAIISTPVTVTVGEEKKDPAVSGTTNGSNGVMTEDGSVRYDNAYEVKVTLTAAAGSAVGVEFVPDFMITAFGEEEAWNKYAAVTNDYSATLGAGTTEFRAALIGVPVDVKDADVFKMYARAFVKNSEGVKAYGDVVAGDFQYTIPK